MLALGGCLVTTGGQMVGLAGEVDPATLVDSAIDGTALGITIWQATHVVDGGPEVDAGPPQDCVPCETIRGNFCWPKGTRPALAAFAVCGGEAAVVLDGGVQ